MTDSSSSTHSCPRCGTALPSAATAGLCPRCLMAEAMMPTQVETLSAQALLPALTPAELAPHFPHLDILECIGRGGMGVVYKARQKALNRLVALKLLAPEQKKDATFAERFTREAQALAALNHPSIVTVYDFGEAGGFYYLLMEYVDGVNLRQAMKAGRFTPEQALAVVPPVCEALQYAHDHGIVHRDIKPENLLLDREGRVKIADFGIAKMLGESAPSVPPATRVGAASAPMSMPAGTPQYMAPEQKAHRTTDHRADIYSLGVVLYELLTGELPADKLQPPSRKVLIDVRLDAIVLRALEQTPELRYQTAVEMRTQLESMVRTPSHSSVPPGTEQPPSAAPSTTPARFSRQAIFGVCWAPFFFIAFLMYFSAQVVQTGPDGPPPQPIWIVFPMALLALGITAPFGTTILGWIAIVNIRRSAGRLYGLRLAVFDGLAFPLLILTSIITWFWRVVFLDLLFPGRIRSLGLSGEDIPLSSYDEFLLRHSTALIVLSTLITASIACTLIVRRVWRTVNRSV